MDVAEVGADFCGMEKSHPNGGEPIAHDVLRWGYKSLEGGLGPQFHHNRSIDGLCDQVFGGRRKETKGRLGVVEWVYRRVWKHCTNVLLLSTMD